MESGSTSYMTAKSIDDISNESSRHDAVAENKNPHLQEDVPSGLGKAIFSPHRPLSDSIFPMIYSEVDYEDSSENEEWIHVQPYEVEKKKQSALAKRLKKVFNRGS